MSLTLQYLGVAGWHFQTGQAGLLIDPYVTRLSVWQVLFGRAVPDRALIRRHTPPAGWILVTHPHYDHIMDVPEVARLTGAPVYASSQGCQLLGVLGLPASQVHAVRPGDRLTLGDFKVDVCASRHRIIFGRIPYQGPLRPGLRPPLRASDYRIDRQFSFLVQAGGLRVLVASGIDEEPSVEADLLLVGADATREQLAAILKGVRPRLVMPNHWDDMFRPLSAPVVPMRKPPRRLSLPLKRIDLEGFARLVRELAPGAEVIVPERFRPYRLGDLL